MQPPPPHGNLRPGKMLRVHPHMLLWISLRSTISSYAFFHSMAQTHERSLTSSQVLKLHAQCQCLACPYLPGLAVTRVLEFPKALWLKHVLDNTSVKNKTYFLFWSVIRESFVFWHVSFASHTSELECKNAQGSRSLLSQKWKMQYCLPLCLTSIAVMPFCTVRTCCKEALRAAAPRFPVCSQWVLKAIPIRWIFHMYI